MTEGEPTVLSVATENLSYGSLYMVALGLRNIGIDPEMPFARWQSLLLGIALLARADDGDQTLEQEIVSRARLWHYDPPEGNMSKAWREGHERGWFAARNFVLGVET